MFKSRIFLLFTFLFLLFGNKVDSYAQVPFLTDLERFDCLVSEDTHERPNAGDFSSPQQFAGSDGVVSAAPTFLFGAVNLVVFLLREILFPKITLAVSIAVPLFTSAYFSNLFSTLIAINAP